MENGAGATSRRGIKRRVEPDSYGRHADMVFNEIQDYNIILFYLPIVIQVLNLVSWSFTCLG